MQSMDTVHVERRRKDQMVKLGWKHLWFPFIFKPLEDPGGIAQGQGFWPLMNGASIAHHPSSGGVQGSRMNIRKDGGLSVGPWPQLNVISTKGGIIFLLCITTCCFSSL